MQESNTIQPDKSHNGSSYSTPAAQLPEDSFHSGIHDIRNTAEEFLIGATVWFDIVSCASTGKAPRLANLHEVFLKTEKTNMADIAGCQSWAASSIGEIATLHAWKEESIAMNNLSMWTLFERAAPIRQQLTEHIAQLRKEIDDAPMAIGQAGTTSSYLIMTDPSACAVALVRAVTLVYAYAAQVYLHTVISGAHTSLDEIRSSVRLTADALEELRAISDPQTLRGILWPICIAGTMAGEVSLQSYFRELIQGLGEEAHDFGNSRTVLNVMEDCWARRNSELPCTESKGWDWLAAMEALDQRVLLV